MQYIYKPLTSGDVEPLKGMLKVFADAFSEPDTYLEKMPSDEYLEAMLGKKHFIALAAFADNEVVGAVAAYELDKFEQDRRELYIYDLAVAEAHRRKGIATGLIDGLRQIAKARGAYLIFVQADKGDEAAIKLYERFGKREDVFQFDITT